jgi:ABC-2 type transport system permease protein
MRWLLVLAVVVIGIAMVIVSVNSKVRTTHEKAVRCEQATNANAETCVVVDVGTRTQDNRFDLETDLGDGIGGTGVTLMLLGLLFGTTFIGADYAGGALAGQLTFEPRRTYLYVVKALVVAIASAVITVFLLLVVTGGLVVVANTRGFVGHLDGEWYVRRAADVGRVAAASAAAAAIGFAVTTIARRSVVAVVGFLALAFILEPALTNALDLFDGKTPLFALIFTAINDFSDAPEGTTSLTKAAVVAALWTAAALAAGGVGVARREVR